MKFVTFIDLAIIFMRLFEAFKMQEVLFEIALFLLDVLTLLM